MLSIHMIEIMAPAWLWTCSLFCILKYMSAPGILPLQLTHCERDNCTTRAWVLSCFVTGRSFCLLVRPRRYLTPQRLSRVCMRCANLLRGTSKSNTVEVLHALLLKHTTFIYIHLHISRSYLATVEGRGTKHGRGHLRIFVIAFLWASVLPCKTSDNYNARSYLASLRYMVVILLM